MPMTVSTPGRRTPPYAIRNELIYIDNSVNLDSSFAFAARLCSTHALQDILEQIYYCTVKDFYLFVQHIFKSGVRNHVLVLAEQIVIHAREEINASSLVRVRQGTTIRDMTESKMFGLA